MELTRSKPLVALPLPRTALAVGGAVFAFGWFLAHDLVSPLAVYIVQLYLTF